MTVDLDIKTTVRMYSVKCDCGTDLRFDAWVDREGDIMVTVQEHKCEQEER